MRPLSDSALTQYKIIKLTAIKVLSQDPPGTMKCVCSSGTPISQEDAANIIKLFERIDEPRQFRLLDLNGPGMAQMANEIIKHKGPSSDASC